MNKFDKLCVITSQNCNKELNRNFFTDLNNFGKQLHNFYQIFSYYFTQKQKNDHRLPTKQLSRKLFKNPISWVCISRCIRLETPVRRTLFFKLNFPKPIIVVSVLLKVDISTVAQFFSISNNLKNKISLEKNLSMVYSHKHVFNKVLSTCLGTQNKVDQ